MLQGLFSTPSMELLSVVDSNPFWAVAEGNYQAAAAMEAIFSQASIGLMATSEYQAMASCGLLNGASAVEGTDETQVNHSTSSCAVPGLSSNSATTASTLGLTSKIVSNMDGNQSAKTTSSVTCNVLHGSHANAQAAAEGLCGGRRSWQEALAPSAHAGSACFYDTIGASKENCSNAMLSSATGTKSAIASLVYPALVDSAGDGKESIQNASIELGASMAPSFCSRGTARTVNWRAASLIPCYDPQISKSGSVDVDSTKDLKISDARASPVIDSHRHTGFFHSGSMSFHKGERPSPHDKETLPTAWTLGQPPSCTIAPRKRPAQLASLSSSAYSKRAHLQNPNCSGSMTTTSPTMTSTASKGSKSSSRHPQGPALNTNGRPRAVQGSANDPQSVAARNRRERINARLKVLQELVPNGSKVDLVTMLEKAINYVKYLQLQLRVLSNDELWHASQDEQCATQETSEEGNNLNESVN